MDASPPPAAAVHHHSLSVLESMVRAVLSDSAADPHRALSIFLAAMATCDAPAFLEWHEVVFGEGGHVDQFLRVVDDASAEADTLISHIDSTREHVRQSAAKLREDWRRLLTQRDGGDSVAQFMARCEARISAARDKAHGGGEAEEEKKQQSDGSIDGVRPAFPRRPTPAMIPFAGFLVRPEAALVRAARRTSPGFAKSVIPTPDMESTGGEVPDMLQACREAAEDDMAMDLEAVVGTVKATMDAALVSACVPHGASSLADLEPFRREAVRLKKKAEACRSRWTDFAAAMPDVGKLRASSDWVPPVLDTVRMSHAKLAGIADAGEVDADTAAYCDDVLTLGFWVRVARGAHEKESEDISDLRAAEAARPGGGGGVGFLASHRRKRQRP